ncbi:MAG: hypothetical protein QOJ23_4341 [Actinomycetota bacterium]|jgi:hypothetical protein|nr:hypothetical protein [Actinomycetota bacterium]
MGASEETVSIRPAAGGPGLKKNGHLSFHQGVLEATDPRGHAHRFDLSDGNGPYEFRYGTWKGEADYALVDRSGHALLLVDTKAFHNDDIMRLQDATGLKFDGAESEPPTRPDTVALVNLPYLRWAMAVFGVGSVAFGLWSVTHVELLVLGVTLPALIILIPLAIFARRSMLSAEDFKADWAKIQPNVDDALAAADEYLAGHGHPPTRNPPEGHGEQAPRTDQPPSETLPDGH